MEYRLDDARMTLLYAMSLPVKPPPTFGNPIQTGLSAKRLLDGRLQKTIHADFLQGIYLSCSMIPP